MTPFILNSQTVFYHKSFLFYKNIEFEDVGFSYIFVCVLSPLNLYIFENLWNIFPNLASWYKLKSVRSASIV